jgi:peptide deformylase
MIRRVRTFPDPLLKQRCHPVEQEAGLEIARDLVDTMRAHPRCVGLAAPQVGETARVAVVDVSRHPAAGSSNGLLLLINPRLIETSGMAIAREGCLSLPAITADVRRARRVTFRPSNDAAAAWAEGFEARALQHELDHLDGILILDRVTSAHALHPRRSG